MGIYPGRYINRGRIQRGVGTPRFLAILLAIAMGGTHTLQTIHQLVDGGHMRRVQINEFEVLRCLVCLPSWMMMAILSRHDVLTELRMTFTRRCCALRSLRPCEKQ